MLDVPRGTTFVGFRTGFPSSSKKQQKKTIYGVLCNELFKLDIIETNEAYLKYLSGTDALIATSIWNKFNFDEYEE